MLNNAHCLLSDSSDKVTKNYDATVAQEFVLNVELKLNVTLTL